MPLSQVMAGLLAVALVVVAADDEKPADPARGVSIAKIVDPEGNPVVGARVTPRAIRARGHGAWRPEVHGEIRTTVTDEQGRAPVDHPTSAFGHAVTAISILIDHPDFCVKDVELPVGSTNENGAGHIPLERGTTVRIQAFDSATSQPYENLIVEMLSYSAPLPPGQMSLFELEPAGENDRDRWHVSRRLPPDARRLVAIVLQDDDVPLFSPVLRWSVDDTTSQTIFATVGPGVRYEGSLDPQVPRPVKNGRVVALATAPPRDEIERRGCAVWNDVVEIAEDGTFVLPSLPRDCDLQIVALCDGWRSAEPDNDACAAFAARYDGPGVRNSPLADPQTWLLEGDVMSGVVAMTPTASCRIRCIDKNGEPLTGIKVGFWPNHYFPGAGSWLFAVAPRSIDYFRTGQRRSIGDGSYSGVTDQDGWAVIRNLPPRRESFSLMKDNDVLTVNGKEEEDLEVTVDSIAEKTVTVGPPVRRP